MPGSGCGPFFVCDKQQLKKKKATWVKHDPVHLRGLEKSQPFLQNKQKPASFHVFPGGGAAVPTTRCSPVTSVLHCRHLWSPSVPVTKKEPCILWSPNRAGIAPSDEGLQVLAFLLGPHVKRVGTGSPGAPLKGILNSAGGSHPLHSRKPLKGSGGAHL